MNQPSAADHGVNAELVTEVREELLGSVRALEAGEAVPQVPSLPVPPSPEAERPRRVKRGRLDRRLGIPF